MPDNFRETQDNLVAALLCLTRAQVVWAGRPDVQAELIRAGAAVADVMDLVAKAQELVDQPLETPRG